MDYRNKFYKMLKRMDDNCHNCYCESCIFDVNDECCIKGLFEELASFYPFNYEDTYIKWFNKWEAKYNELYERITK